MLRVYGIPNCDTVKKARAWLDARGVSYEFVDFKKVPPPEALIARWIATLGRDRVVNRRGTTWRGLPPDVQARADTDAGAVAVLSAHPSTIKRPVVDTGEALIIGFDEREFEQTLR
jgi:Spx/MgsR family transcriptional regulator